MHIATLRSITKAHCRALKCRAQQRIRSTKSKIDGLMPTCDLCSLHSPWTKNTSRSGQNHCTTQSRYWTTFNKVLWLAQIHPVALQKEGVQAFVCCNGRKNLSFYGCWPGLDAAQDGRVEDVYSRIYLVANELLCTRVSSSRSCSMPIL